MRPVDAGVVSPQRFSMLQASCIDAAHGQRSCRSAPLVNNRPAYSVLARPERAALPPGAQPSSAADDRDVFDNFPAFRGGTKQLRAPPSVANGHNGH